VNAAGTRLLSGAASFLLDGRRCGECPLAELLVAGIVR